MDDTKSADEEMPAPNPSKGKAKESEVTLYSVTFLSMQRIAAVEQDRKGKKKASSEGFRFDTGFFDDDVAAGVAYESDNAPRNPDEVPEPKIEKPVVPQAHLTVRLGTPEFEADFDGDFAIGPGRLHGLAPHILPVYLCLPVALKAGASPAAVSAVHEQSHRIFVFPPSCLLHLRFKQHRSQWDPRGGCRELATILKTKDSGLPVATEEDFRRLNLNLLIATLDKGSPNVSEIVFLLMDALGDASNPREMTAELVLKDGEFGMLRCYTLVVARVLDNLDTTHPEYPSLLSSIQNASAGIARKIRNHFKSGGDKY
ncbi:hypothetical protein B0H14DRAFT_3495839 [Mycena olivaceomarginata]|nr:hypothetical protein B0H14DRAFT_3495839 [Mycena olivaceomarginata]